MTAALDTSAINAEASLGEPTPSTPDLLNQRLDQVDLLIADLGQASEFTNKAVKFVEEATTEAKWNRIARAWTLVVVLLIIGGLALII